MPFFPTTVGGAPTRHRRSPPPRAPSARRTFPREVAVRYSVANPDSGATVGDNTATLTFADNAPADVKDLRRQHLPRKHPHLHRREEDLRGQGDHQRRRHRAAPSVRGDCPHHRPRRRWPPRDHRPSGSPRGVSGWTASMSMDSRRPHSAAVPTDSARATTWIRGRRSRTGSPCTMRWSPMRSRRADGMLSGVATAGTTRIRPGASATRSPWRTMSTAPRTTMPAPPPSSAAPSPGRRSMPRAICWRGRPGRSKEATTPRTGRRSRAAPATAGRGSARTRTLNRGGSGSMGSACSTTGSRS